MNINEIPLSPDNQQFDITLDNVSYKIRLIWRESSWFLDLQSDDGADIIAGIPLVSGINLLAQYAYLQLGFGLVVLSDTNSDEAGQFDLGYSSHLCVISETT